MSKSFFRYFSALGLIALMSLPAWLNWASFRYQQEKHRQQVKQSFIQSVDPANLLTFRFSLDEYQSLRWDDDFEFYYQGHKYDVHSRDTLSDGQICLHVLPDALEEKMEALFASNENRQDDSHVDQLKRFFNGFINPDSEPLSDNQIIDRLASRYFSRPLPRVLREDLIPPEGSACT